GVLNTGRGKQYWRKNLRQKTYTFNADFCPDAIANLNRITEESGARIVISSYWRSFFALDALKVIFQEYGIEGEVIDTIPMGEEYGIRPDRGTLIKQWLMENEEPDRFVIIDDNDSGISRLFPKEFIRVEEEEGLANLSRFSESLSILLN
ncbi:MAG: HAD domain-containing protein, partial [Bacteroidota bacterium]